MPISYTNRFNNVIDALKTIIASEFTGIYVVKGDIQQLPFTPAITIEPFDENPDSEATFGKKDIQFTVQLWFYTQDGQTESAVVSITDIGARMEQLLINNKEYPSGGDTWYNSNIVKVSYGLKQKTGGLFRSGLIEWVCNGRFVR